MRSSRNGRYLILALCLSMAACATTSFSSYGRITPNGEVTKAIESYQVNPEFRYFTTGSDFKPAALIGLHTKYRIDPSTNWKEVEMSTGKMKEIVEDMTSRSIAHQRNFQGSEMSDDNGRPIGIWYSTVDARTFLRMNSDGTVWIDTPDR